MSDSVDALVAAASRPGSNIAAAWVLHALWLVACNSGGAFVPRVRTVLQLGQELLVGLSDSWRVQLRGVVAPMLCSYVRRLHHTATMP